jgi:hypothetical protein
MCAHWVIAPMTQRGKDQLFNDPLIINLTIADPTSGRYPPRMSAEPARIYLIYRHSLLRDSVQAILNQAGLILAGESLGAIELESLAAIRPDIIIVEDGETEIIEHILTHLTELGSPRLLALSLKDNKFYIYHREERLLTQTADLVAALQR